MGRGHALRSQCEWHDGPLDAVVWASGCCRVSLPCLNTFSEFKSSFSTGEFHRRELPA